jgi:hypothetical protein
LLDPDPDPGGQNLPTSIEISEEFSCFEVLDVLFVELKASPVQVPPSPQGCGSGSAWIRINLSGWIRSGSRRAKMTHKYRKSKEFSCFEVLDVLF